MFGIAINPETDIDVIKEYLPLIHLVLVMGVKPGKGGQEFIPETVQKIESLKKYIDENNLDLDIEVDGGVNDKTAERVVEAGANILVAGAYITSKDDPKEAISFLKSL